MPTLASGAEGVIAYDEYGAGPVVVLLHGSPGTSKAWLKVAERLADRFRVIAPNLPGYGETSAAPAGAPPDNAYATRLVETLLAEVGTPRVLAGHSYGGVIALRVALGGAVAPRALALFEPVAVPLLEALGEAEVFADSKAVFDRYLAAFDRGDGGAVRIMVDYWFGAGAYEHMAPPMKEFLSSHTAHNVHDVRATFRERYTTEALRRLPMPVQVVCGTRGPEAMTRICRGIAAHAPQGSLVTLEKATHALTATHADAVADLIAALAARDGG
jgi:pimeloyl-ACP methyl ester carboxylesterase